MVVEYVRRPKPVSELDRDVVVRPFMFDLWVTVVEREISGAMSEWTRGSPRYPLCSIGRRRG